MLIDITEKELKEALEIADHKGVGQRCLDPDWRRYFVRADFYPIKPNKREIGVTVGRHETVRWYV